MLLVVEGFRRRTMAMEVEHESYIALTRSAEQEQVEGFNLLAKWKGQDVPVIQAPSVPIHSQKS